MHPEPPPIEGAPYLARSLRRICETADLSTPLRSGRDDKVRCNCQPNRLPFFLRLCLSFCHSRRESARRMDPEPPPIEGAPYLARSLRQMWETADLSTPLRSGRDDKVRCNCQPNRLPFFLRLCLSFCHSRRESTRRMDPKPPRIEGAPYLARSLRRIWETADFSTPLRSGRDDKVRCNWQPNRLPFFSVFAFLSVIPEGNLLYVPEIRKARVNTKGRSIANSKLLGDGYGDLGSVGRRVGSR